MKSIYEQKQALRATMKAVRKANLTPSFCQTKSLHLHEMLTQRRDFMQCEVVLFYAALPLEVSTWDCLEAWNTEKTLLLPVVCGDSLSLVPYRGRAHCKVSPWGVVEPMGEAFTAYHTIEMAFIPALAYDLRGYRLGYGRGYYDRLLQHSALQTCHTVGLAFDFQVVDVVPTEAHDQPLNEIMVV